MERVAVLAITRNGVGICRKIRSHRPSWEAFAPSKLDDGAGGITWYAEPTREKAVSLFESFEGIVCVFSLGAVIRLIAPHMRDKRSDPAVLVVDDRATFVISALSGHIGGANELARGLASEIGATPVVTTAADVNHTIAVDLVGREEGWRIDGDEHVTAVSAMMVNGERVGVYQDAGDPSALPSPLPSNVTAYSSIGELLGSGCAGALVITDAVRAELPPRTVVYRPRSLVAGVGVHADTPAKKIAGAVLSTLVANSLSAKSLARIASIKKPRDVPGLAEAAEMLGVPLELVSRDELAATDAPNPSETVRRLEGTPSVSEAAALVSSQGRLVVQKQKFPPDLTVAVARVAA